MDWRSCSADLWWIARARDSSTGLGVAVWSLVQAAAGAVSGIWAAVKLRIALGIAESPLSPATMRALKTWFRPEDRGLAISICFSGAALGPASLRRFSRR